MGGAGCGGPSSADLGLHCASLPSFVGFVAFALLLLVVLSAAMSRRARRKHLARIRANWGRPLVRERRLPAIAEYFRSRASTADSDGFLDDHTWDDLNLDAVFEQLDRTESTLGQQALYCRLRQAPAAADLEAFEQVVSRMAAEPSTRERAQLALSHLQNPSGYDLWWLARPDAIERRPWHVVYPLAGLTMLTAVVASLIWPGVLLLVIAGAVLNLVVRATTAGRVIWVVEPFRQVAAVLAVADALLFLADNPGAPIAGSLRHDLPMLRRLKRLARSIGPDPLRSNEIVYLVMEYLNVLFLLDVNAVYFAARELRKSGPALLRVLDAVGGVDAAISVASVRAGANEWTRASFVAPGSPIRIERLGHPLIAHAVPNSLELEPGRGALITGSNMSGKTTFIRTAGVNVVLAQTINTCFADRYEAPVLRVCSCIGTADDLLAGKSYYLAEVERVLSLVTASGSRAPHVFLLDELFRGTNAIERIAAAEAVLKELVAAGGGTPHYVVAATHDGELVDFLAGLYSAFHFGDQLGTDGLAFDYRLHPGMTHTRNALALLRLHGAPPAMISRAVERASQLDRLRSAAAPDPLA